MFDATSRYAKVPDLTLTVTDPDGTQRTVTYKARRFVPSTKGATTLLEHTVAEGERLDVITARYIADPTQYWRICDANTVLRPEELTDQPGSVIEIAMPGP